MSESTALQNYEAELAKEAENLKDTLSGPNSNKISTKGKLFTLPDGRTSPGPLRCVILDYLSFNSKYEGIYDPNKPESPVCWAINRVVHDLAPSANCPTPQAESCTACPHDKFGSSGKGKSCKNVRRLVVVEPDADENSEIMTLEVSPSAIRAFDAYVRKVNSMFNTMPVRVITTISFDPNKTYPTLVFHDPEPHDQLPMMMQLRTAAQPMLLREPNID